MNVFKTCSNFEAFMMAFSVMNLSLSVKVKAKILLKKKNLKKTLWSLFMDGVQLPQGYNHFEEV